MSEILVDNLTGKTSAGSITVYGEGGTATTNLQQGVTKVWASTPADGASITDSFNVASLTDVDTGKQQPNFTNDMNNSTFVINVTYDDNAIDYAPWGSARTTSSYRTNAHTGFGYYDVAMFSSVQGDLA